MPVITNTRHPNPYGADPHGPSAISIARAVEQTVRPLEILIVNLMAEKETTGRLLAEWLGDTPLQVNLTFAATDKWMSDIESGRRPAKNTPIEYIQKCIHPFSAISHKKFDGFVLTGFDARKERVEEEELYPEVADILRHMEDHATSSLFLCYGAKAALNLFHNIPSYKTAPGPLAEKRFGVFEFSRAPNADEANLLRGLPAKFPMPVARWKSPDAEAIARNTSLKVIATSVETGPGIIVETLPYDDGRRHFAKRAYILPHPEYDAEAMDKEYRRDKKNGVNTPFPKGLYRNDDIKEGPVNSWHYTGRIYSNWLNYNVYPATQPNIKNVPAPYVRPAFPGQRRTHPEEARHG